MLYYVSESGAIASEHVWGCIKLHAVIRNVICIFLLGGRRLGILTPLGWCYRIETCWRIYKKKKRFYTLCSFLGSIMIIIIIFWWLVNSKF